MAKSLVRASGARGAGQDDPPDSPGGYSEPPSAKPATSHPRASESRPAPADDDYCGADGAEHDWVVSYWIGGERDENGEHVVCHKCGKEYL